MGLKSGSRDSGLDDEQNETQEKNEQQEGNKQQDEDGSAGLSEGISDTVDSVVETAQAMTDDASDVLDGECEEPDQSEQETSEETDEESSEHPAVDSIPYKLRRQNVNDGREQVPYFLRPEITDGETQLKETLEDELGETVYKSDYREAAMIVAQRNPELIAEVLREWGYDLDGR